jgi:membrane-associated protein
MSSSGWTYLLVLAVCAADAVLPILPGETMVITGGVLASTGDLNIILVAGAGALGVFLGDTTSYLLGHRFGRRVADRLLRGERGKKWLAWAERTLNRRGMALIVMARFIPGGRTATTLTAGTINYPWPKFAVAAGIGGCLWAGYNVLLGAAGGHTFERQPWKGLLLALGLATVSALLVDATQWLVSRRRYRRTSDREDRPAKETAA